MKQRLSAMAAELGVASGLARRFVEACGDQASHSIRGAIDDVLEVGTDVDDGGHGRLRHVGLHQAIPVVVAAPAIRAAQADHDSLNDIVAVNQRAVQAAVGVVRQPGRGQESAALKFDVHDPTSWGHQGLAARPM